MKEYQRGTLEHDLIVMGGGEIQKSAAKLSEEQRGYSYIFQKAFLSSLYS